MSENTERDPMLDMYIFETMQLMEQLEQSVLNSEKISGDSESINEIFRIMHTIKGSSGMMLFNNITILAHALEDLFFYLRENKPKNVDYAALIDIVLEGIDFIKVEILKIENGSDPNGDPSKHIETARGFLEALKNDNADGEGGIATNSAPSTPQKYYISYDKTLTESTKNNYSAVIFFEDNCEMEHIRAFTVVCQLKEIAEDIQTIPSNLMENTDDAQLIKNEGLKLLFKSKSNIDEVRKFLLKTPFLKSLDLAEASETENEEGIKEKPKKEIILEDSPVHVPIIQKNEQDKENTQQNATAKQGLISVGINKLDKLMDLVGELVISEAMVTRNPELVGLQLDNFYKAARQLRKITNELQDAVMSIRMVPLSMTFQKMNRIVRDMCRKLDKEVELEIRGEETEVDKNIIEHISDPLMHLIRNSLDHGIESIEERKNKGKNEIGKILLEAKNAGGDVLIIVKDDGKGLDRDKILKKAKENRLITKSESEMTDKEIYSLIFLPGFSTKEKVTEFSGRGVGMDVVVKNIEKVGGSVSIDSTPNEGTTMIIKIPLTLAIVDGMTIRVGNSRYTVPTTSIRESFRMKEEDIIIDPDGNEMVLIRGICYPILRLHELYKVSTKVTKLHEGIIMMVENEDKHACLFADELIGEQQVVVKALPKYIKKIRGIAGCTLLGDGSVSLILDAAGLINKN